MKITSNPEVGSQYKINGRVYTVTEQVDMSAYPHLAKYTTAEFELVGKRGAVRRLAIRHSRSAFTYGWAAGATAEVVTYEPMDAAA